MSLFKLLCPKEWEWVNSKIEEEQLAMEKNIRRLQRYEIYTPIMKLLYLIDRHKELPESKRKSEYVRIKREVMDQYGIIIDNENYNVK